MHDGHRNRMRKRFLKDANFDNFAPHEILELLLYSTISRRDTNPIAHALIREFGSLSGVLDASPEQLKKVDGVGENTAFMLSMMPSLFAAYNQAKWERNIALSTTDIAGQFAINLFIGKPYEEFRIICVDSARRVTYQGAIAHGTINEVPSYPRLAVEEVLKHKAQNVIFTHNHPNGSLQPSEGDKIATEQLLSAMDAIGVSVLDHIIVSGNRYFSMADMGLL